MADLETKAREIQESGNYLLIHALERGMEGNSHYHPDNKTIEAYRIGLNIFFRRINFDDLISAEQIIQLGNIPLQQGFFDRFCWGFFGWGFLPNDTKSEASRKKYQEALDGHMRLYVAGIVEECHYTSHVKGALIALEVWEGFAKKCAQASYNPPDEILQMLPNSSSKKIYSLDEVLAAIRSERKDLLHRLQNPASYPFSAKEQNRLEFIRWLRESGKLES